MREFAIFSTWLLVLLGTTGVIYAFLAFGPGVPINGSLIGGTIVGVITSSVALHVAREADRNL